jgi:hypothetical protein
MRENGRRRRREEKGRAEKRREEKREVSRWKSQVEGSSIDTHEYHVI